MLRMRGRYYKYTGKIAEEIIKDYQVGLPIKQIRDKYKISFGGIYGLIHRKLQTNQTRKGKNGVV